jgi:hypothetical protein
MSEHKLLEKAKIDEILFSKKIKKEHEDMFVNKYGGLTRNINGLTKTFLVNVSGLKDLLLINSDKKYCKFYYTQKNNSLNIGLSFSNKDSEILNENDDVFYELDGEFFNKINFKEFSLVINKFASDLGNKLKTQTKSENCAITYNLQIVDFYITSLELHFPINQLKFNMFQYSSTDLNGTILTDFMNKDGKISFCVHALITNTENDKILAESDGYDLGNLRP